MKAVFLAILFFGLAGHARAQLNAKISEGIKQVSCAAPDEMNPVTLNAKLVREGDSIGIIVKVSMAEGWHIYGYVPSTLPYIPIDHILGLPKNIRAVGKWQKTAASGSAADPGVLIYEDEAVFVHKAVKLPGAKAGEIIKAGLYYQVCNLRQCLAPAEKILELRL